MAKLAKAPKKVIKKDPQVNENPIKEEVVEEVKEIVSPEAKFVKGLERLVEAKVMAGGNRFLGIEEILPVFKSVI